jgi:hypothetical protein
MTLIHIEFIKTFKMSLKYIYILCLCATCFSHTGPPSGNTCLRNPLHCALCLKVLFDKVHSPVDSFKKKALPDGGPVWPKHVAHKHKMYIYIF